METGIQVSSLKPLLTTPEEVRTACAKMAELGSGPVQLQWIDPAVQVGERYEDTQQKQNQFH